MLKSSNCCRYFVFYVLFSDISHHFSSLIHKPTVLVALHGSQKSDDFIYHFLHNTDNYHLLGFVIIALSTLQKSLYEDMRATLNKFS